MKYQISSSYAAIGKFMLIKNKKVITFINPS